MRKATTKRLFIATFWFGVAFACFRARAPSPYVVAIAGLALSYAIMSIVGQLRTERATLVMTVFLLLSTMTLFGVALAILGR